MYKIDWSKYLSEKRLKASSVPPDLRNAFESDFGRVAFSSALRRMHDKTQVFPLTNGDCVHTRLTHSIEVMNIAHSLAIFLCRNKEFIETYGESEAYLLEQKISPILRTAAIIHDIGNPPFGHFGEEIIQDYFKNLQSNISFDPDFVYFDGNAQGFRVITRLQYMGYMSGLNLTYATLAAYLKYPNISKPQCKDYVGCKKHGVYTTEADILEKITEACSLRRHDGIIKRHPLSFLVEAADTICYRVMDIEDSIYLHWNITEDLIKYADNHLNGKTFFDILQIDKEKFNGLNDNHKFVNIRVKVINYLVKLASNNFIKNLEAIENGDYSNELLDDDPYKIEKVLKAFFIDQIVCRPEVEKAELTGKAVLSGLFDILSKLLSHSDRSFRNRLKSSLSKSVLKTMIHVKEHSDVEYLKFSPETIKNFDFETLDETEKYTILRDYISGMTDWYAVELYQQLSGYRL